MENRQITFASMFSGCGGFDLGFHQAGFDCLWTSEINKDSSDVLAKLGAPNLGDVTKIDGTTVPVPDVVIWGSPCQSFSVANTNRTGLEGESGLFYDGLNVVRQLARRGLGLSVWENVAGAFTANQGRDFRRILHAFLQCGATDIGWRVLDGKYFGVPQSRRRIILVADFRGRRCGEILCYSEAGRLCVAPRKDDGVGDSAGETTEATTARHPSRQRRPEQTHWGIKGGHPREEMSPGCMIRHPSIVAGSGPCRSITPGCITPALQARKPSGNANRQMPGELLGTRLRWRTPLESDRLMGWPDDWTATGASGKVMSDAARYRMTGNGVIAPMAKWLAGNIKEAQ